MQNIQSFKFKDLLTFQDRAKPRNGEGKGTRVQRHGSRTRTKSWRARRWYQAPATQLLHPRCEELSFSGLGKLSICDLRPSWTSKRGDARPAWHEPAEAKAGGGGGDREVGEQLGGGVQTVPQPVCQPPGNIVFALVFLFVFTFVFTMMSLEYNWAVSMTARR